MSDETPQLGLPLILPAQAQKHVTHNEGLALLDALVQPAVITFATDTPPATPAEGDRHVVGPAPAGLWAGQPGKLAVYDGGLWRFLTPNEGWVVQVPALQSAAVYEGGAWRLPSGRPLTASQLGVGTAADAFNVLSVAGPATLLTHAGTGGHQVKINKADQASTASVLFQTAFSGRAELGTMGSDNFSVKVSPNGTAFADAIVIPVVDASVSVPGGLVLPDGTATLPGLRFAADSDTGLHRNAANQLALVTEGVVRAQLTNAAMQIDVPVTGASVTQTAIDTTVGRLTRTGDFGLGLNNAISTEVTDMDLHRITGQFRFASATIGRPPTGSGVFQHLIRHSTSNAFAQVQFAFGNDYRIYHRALHLGVWTAWQRVYQQGDALGTVSQTAGVPTGALIESGSNANGTYRRFACGMQVCWREALSAANVSTANGSLFRSASVTWTFPVTFIAAPVVTGQSDSADIWMAGALPTTTTVALRLHSATTVAGATAFRAVASGRWF
ncbi:MAG: DUF2793 domain-containing protein [Gemmobacter sp.]